MPDYDNAKEVVTAAYQMLGVLDIADGEPSEAEISSGLKYFSRMIADWRNKSLIIKTVLLTCDTTAGSKSVTNVEDVNQIAPMLNVSGTGIATGTRIASIDRRTNSLLLDTAATLSGTSVPLTFDLFPMPEQFERGTIALLAMELAGPSSIKSIPPMVVEVARDGWIAIRANYFVLSELELDLALTNMGSRRSGGSTILG